MITRLEALAPTLAVLLAMSAIAATSAQAEQSGDFWAETGTVKIDAAIESNQQFVVAGKTLTCTGIAAHAQYSKEYSSQTVTNIGYSGCTGVVGGITFPATVTPEPGCHYTVTAGTYTSGAGLSHGSVHICASTVDIYTNHSNHTAGIKRCQMHVPAQAINGLTFINTTTPNGKMGTTVEANGVTLANVTLTDFNTLGCTDHVTESAVYTGTAWVEATDSEEGATGNTVTGT